MLMMRRAAILALFLAAAPAALAEDAPAPAAAPPQPCQRGAASVRMAGIDLDDMRCHYAVALQQLAATSLEIVDRDARLRMMASDLAAAQAELAKLKAAKPADPAKP